MHEDRQWWARSTDRSERPFGQVDMGHVQQKNRKHLATTQICVPFGDIQVIPLVKLHLKRFLYHSYSSTLEQSWWGQGSITCVYFGGHLGTMMAFLSSLPILFKCFQCCFHTTDVLQILMEPCLPVFLDCVFPP